MAAGSTSLCTRATCSAPAVGKARQRRKSSQSNFPVNKIKDVKVKILKR